MPRKAEHRSKDGIKKCSKCGEPKPLDEFYKDKRNTWDERMGMCKFCFKPLLKAWESKHRAERTARQRHANMTPQQIKRKSGYLWEQRIKHLYKLTPEDYYKMLALQQGVCAIYKERASSALTDRLCVDHDHATGQVRGLLCQYCNTALGQMKDNPGLLRMAANYLEAHAAS